MKACRSVKVFFVTELIMCSEVQTHSTCVGWRSVSLCHSDGQCFGLSPFSFALLCYRLILFSFALTRVSTKQQAAGLSVPDTPPAFAGSNKQLLQSVWRQRRLLSDDSCVCERAAIDERREYEPYDAVAAQAVLPQESRMLRELQVRFMHERGWLQG
jgi:hypothetical protein